MAPDVWGDTKTAASCTEINQKEVRLGGQGEE